MKIDWAALASVFGVSLVVTVALVGLFTLGIVGLSKQAATASAGSSGGSLALARTGAYLCFGLCAAAVSYGIYLIVV
ncbi:hypothetical protein F0344_29105 [Streptomyces finlayi]|uniref:Uncharacterized protein n=1 Tax=Streptomyces finlayi TaxID=67296 RepID=A0A7G7BS01_9ACTN|nr:hypothetical protein [Streptomyces finlayi]QNE78116.1 hypothetical protein F0344_29105 [Streptomyces finlayi]